MSGETRIDAEAVRALATAAALPLEPERAEDLAERMTVWLTAANELNEKMSAPEHLPLAPIASFTHPDPEVSE
jgi:Asp-tRNA(Asn)/Glu-tRNA(Gln) amidotransferase C subunit